MNAAFTRRVVDEAGIKVVNIAKSHAKQGRWVWIKLEGDALATSGRTFRTEELAYEAAIKTFTLRTA